MLLDEPLANLDYKLREELRAELPRIFEISGAIFVYATTEPSEALLLGGRTICMSEGRALQIGDTSTVYHRPETLRVAELFSDPPLNTVAIEKKNGAVAYARRRYPRRQTASMPRLPDGPYTRRLPCPSARRRQRARRATTSSPRPWRSPEIAGSESFVHLQRNGTNWVAVLPGVHEFPPGQTVEATLDPDDLFIFDPDGRLVAAPRRRVRRTMARIDLVDLAPLLRTEAGNADPSSFALKPIIDDLAPGRRLCPAGTVGLRQDHLAQHHFRDRAAVARQGPVRRQAMSWRSRPSSATSPRSSSFRSSTTP